mmetsp:Transcript_19013/g.47976  ORF Transcript_19013/g.47976 Transcript_19013/m.47976 type:complete len:298 (+) Transcript_19013:493-1386(+)
MHARVPPVKQLEHVVLALVVPARVPDLGHGELGVLHAIRLLPTLAEGAAVTADDGRVTEVGVNPVVARGVGDSDVAVVHEGHCLCDKDLLIFARRHVSLAPDHELRALHAAVPPDLRVVAVIADNQADLEALGPLRDEGGVTGVPSLDGAPGDDLAVLLDDLSLVVDEDEGVVGLLPGVLLVLLPSDAEDTPHLALPARLGKLVRLRAGDLHRRRHALVLVVHDAVGRVLGEDDQVHAWQALLRTLDQLTDSVDVLVDLLQVVKPGHLVLEDAGPDSVGRRTDVSVPGHISRGCCLG